MALLGPGEAHGEGRVPRAGAADAAAAPDGQHEAADRVPVAGARVVPALPDARPRPERSGACGNWRKATAIDFVAAQFLLYQLVLLLLSVRHSYLCQFTLMKQ